MCVWLAGDRGEQGDKGPKGYGLTGYTGDQGPTGKNIFESLMLFDDLVQMRHYSMSTSAAFYELYSAESSNPRKGESR